MKKKLLSILLILTLVLSSLTCLSAVSAGAAEITSAQSGGSENLEGWLDSVQAGENCNCAWLGI